MQLRTSRILKLFVVLLFSLESLAPSVLSSSFHFADPTASNRVEKSFTHHALTLSIFAEERATEERSDNNVATAVENSFAINLLKGDPENLVNARVATQENYSTVEAPLFQLHHRYRL
jgi:hypothetical protein